MARPKNTDENKNKEIKQEPFFYSYLTFLTLSDKKKAFLRSTYKAEFYSVAGISRVADVSRATVYEWLKETGDQYDITFKALLEEILSYKENERLEEENELKSKIKKIALSKLLGVVAQIDESDISKPESPILIFANKALNGLSETTNNKTELSGGLTVKSSVANLSDSDLDKEIEELEAQSE